MVQQILARGIITISAVSDGYTTSLTAPSVSIPSNYNGSKLDYSNAKTIITISKGGVSLPFRIVSVVPSSNSVQFEYNKLTDTSWEVAITNVTSSVISGFLSITIQTEEDYLNTVKFNFAIVKDAAGLEWITDWNSTYTQIGDNYVITPKLFAGKKDENGKITGVYLGQLKGMVGGTSASTKYGLYGYKDNQIVFSIDNNGAVLGGWQILPNVIQNNDGSMQIKSEGAITASKSGVTLWSLDKNGAAVFAKGNAKLNADGSGSIAGQNIVWDANGTVSFSDNVLLKWTQISGITTIDKDGIYTGNIAAKQITSGYISADRIQAGSITTDKIAANAITADKIAAGSITTDKIAAKSITAEQIGGLETLETKDGNFRINEDGTIIAQGATIKGTITATSGKIASFKIEGSWIQGSNLGLSGSQLHFVQNDSQVYVGSHPDMSVGGGEKLGWFAMTSPSIWIKSGNKVCMACFAPSDERNTIEAFRSYAIWAEGCSCLSGIRLRFVDEFRTSDGAMHAEVTRGVSLVRSWSAEMGLWGHGIEEGHVVMVLNLGEQNLKLAGDVVRNGIASHVVHKKSCKWLVWMGGRFYPSSDHTS